jgi:hypothetical protein
MTHYKLSISDLFLTLNCALMAYTQLDDIDLNSTTNSTKSARDAVFQVLISSIKNGIGNDLQHTITLELNDAEKNALIGLLAHGTYWFDPSLLALGKSEALQLVQRLEA